MQSMLPLALCTLFSVSPQTPGQQHIFVSKPEVGATERLKSRGLPSPVIGHVPFMVRTKPTHVKVLNKGMNWGQHKRTRWGASYKRHLSMPIKYNPSSDRRKHDLSITRPLPDWAALLHNSLLLHPSTSHRLHITFNPDWLRVHRATGVSVTLWLRSVG